MADPDSDALTGIRATQTAEGALHLRGVYQMATDSVVCTALEMKQGAGLVPMVRLEVGGVPVLALVDSGASVSLATYQASRVGAIRVLGPEPTRFESMTFRGAREAVVGVIPELRLGDLRIGNVPVGIVNRLPGVSPTLDVEAEVGVLLGQDFMQRFIQIRFDPEAGEICWVGKGARRKPNVRQSATVLATCQGDNGLPRFKGRIAGRGPVDMVWDSGGEFGLWIPWSLAGQLDLPVSLDPIESRAAIWFRASTSRRIHPCAAEVGGLLIPFLTTYVGTIRGGRADPEFVLLGSEVLERHMVTIDNERCEIRFCDLPETER
jgi:hypothetical protein